MKFEIISFRSAGPLNFGMTRNQVRAALAPAKATARISYVNKLPLDFFVTLSVKAIYDAGEILQAVEFASPAIPEYHGKRLLGLRLKEARETLEELDPATDIEDDGITCPTIGIGVYIPGARKKPGGRVEGVITFQKDYYDKT